MGEMLPARRAGPRAAASVTTIPTATEATKAETGRLGSSSVTSPTVRTQATMIAASSEPMTTPSSDPTTPRRNAWRRTNPVIWPRVAPAARRSPSSRARSTSVMESVLKMRNAPVNSAIAAMSAVVAWKSAVDDRSEAARSAGDDSTYGSMSRRPSSAVATASGSVPSASAMSTRETASWSKAACAVRSGTMTARPSVPTVGPSPSRMPTTR